MSGNSNSEIAGSFGFVSYHIDDLPCDTIPRGKESIVDLATVVSSIRDSQGATPDLNFLADKAQPIPYLARVAAGHSDGFIVNLSEFEVCFNISLITSST